MLLAALWVALQGGEAARRDPVLGALEYLVRHQNEDGSWGARPPGCACPPERRPRLDEAGRKRVLKLLEALSSERIEVRDGAEAELVAIGRPVLEELSMLKGRSPEVRGREQRIAERLRIAPARSETELTGLALLALFSHGLTRLSGDVYEGKRCGLVIEKGTEWLRKRDGPWAAVALCESYGSRWSDDARRAAEGVRASRAEGGEALAWKAIALHSAAETRRVPEHSVDRPALAQLVEAQANGWEKLAGLLSGRDLRPNQGLCGARVTRLSPGTNRLLVLALDGAEPPERQLAGAGWEGLFERAQAGQRIEKSCEGGSWDAEGLRRRLAETARRALALAACSYPYDGR